jgi:ribosome-associated protein
MNFQDIIKELSFRTSRSSGAGGQNVNKVSSKVEVLLDVPQAIALSEGEKAIILEKLAGKINSEGILGLTCQTSRSQLINKELAIEKLEDLLVKTLLPEKIRKPTRIPAAIDRARRENKAAQATKKAFRGKVTDY